MGMPISDTDRLITHLLRNRHCAVSHMNEQGHMRVPQIMHSNTLQSHFAGGFDYSIPEISLAARYSAQN